LIVYVYEVSPVPPTSSRWLLLFKIYDDLPSLFPKDQRHQLKAKSYFNIQRRP